MMGLIDEYSVLCRQWARAQRHADQGLRQWQQRCAALEADLIRLRGRLLAVRTALLWSIPVAWAWTSGTSGRIPESSQDPSQTVDTDVDANRVLCRVGCQSQGHPPLEPDGTCRWHGGPCGAISSRSEPVAQTQSIK